MKVVTLVGRRGGGEGGRFSVCLNYSLFLLCAWRGAGVHLVREKGVICLLFSQGFIWCEKKVLFFCYFSVCGGWWGEACGLRFSIYVVFVYVMLYCILFF